ncbi:hypothetical protein KAR91_50135 [Candidatus Pacearchaeota archaeon]|nr:hypothetical protein [Candidatus Pacearchaeota archaeon]
MTEKKKDPKITEVKAKSEIKAKAMGVKEFKGEAPEDEETQSQIIKENVIDEVEPETGS